MVVGTEREVERGHARRQRGEDLGALAHDPEHRARAIADVQLVVPAEGDAARDAEIRGDHFGVAVRVDPVHAAIEPAGHVEASVPIEGQRGGVREVAHERHAGAVRTDLVDRDRRLLPSRSAERDVEIARRVERRVVDLVQPGGERHADLDEGCLAFRAFDPDRGPPPFQPRRHGRGQAAGRSEGDVRTGAADGDARRPRLHRKVFPEHRDAPPFDGPEGLDRGDPSGGTVSPSFGP